MAIGPFDYMIKIIFYLILYKTEFKYKLKFITLAKHKNIATIIKFSRNATDALEHLKAKETHFWTQL